MADIRDDPSDEDEAIEQPVQTESRDRELSTIESINSECLKIYRDVEQGFQNQWDRANSQMDYWDIYHCQLGPKQFYTGNSQIFVPIVHDAVNARVTRFNNQIFPQSGKHIEVTASEDKPTAIMSLLEHYIRKAKLRTNVMPALIRNGDIEGQYNIYVKWVRNERHVAMRINKKKTVDDMEIDDEYEDIDEQTIVHQYPMAEVIADADVLVLPFTSDSVEAAIDNGGSVSIIRRYSKAKIRQMIRDGEFEKEAGQNLLATMAGKGKNQSPNKKKNITTAAGIQTEGDQKTALVYETWTKLKVDGERRIVRIYFGGEDQVSGCKLNPYWCDKVPLLSAPVEKIEGSFKGNSKIKFVETLQYAANDAVNEGMDSAAYALLPIIMTDPAKNPRTGSMVLNVAAIWETSPKDTQFAEFPQLWKEAFQIVSSAKDQIFQTLSVNPAMMPQQVTAPGKKPNQAQIASEQQVDLLTTADSVTTIEQEILTPYLQWCVWLDHQFRDEKTTVPSFGELGVKMQMEEIPPIQMGKRFEFRWYGVEAARNMQQIQQQMAGLNVLRGIPPQLYPGRTLDLGPLMSAWVDNIYGARLGPLIFKNTIDQLGLNPEYENQMLEQGMHVSVQPMDNDQEHIKAHMQAFQEKGDFSGQLRAHMIEHQMQMQKKQQAAMIQQQQQLQGPQQGGGGQPRQGAAPGGPRPNGQGPPGMIHQDRIPMGAPRQRGAM